MIIRRLIVPLAVAFAALQAGGAVAQGSFPAPLPGQTAAPANSSPFPPAGGSPFPPAGGAPAAAPPPAAASSFPATGAAPLSSGAFGGAGPAPPTSGPSEACMKGFIPLREEAERRGKAIKAASDRKAPPEEACKLIGNFGAAEIKMIKYVEANAAKCGIPPQITEQLKAGHKGTESMQAKVCGYAQQAAQQKASSAPSLSEALGSTAGPEPTASRKGGSTFDTLNGNVLSR